MNSLKKLKYLLIISGGIIIILDVFSDLILKRTSIHFGPLQWVGLILGLLVLFVGISWRSPWIIRLFSSVKFHLTKEIHIGRVNNSRDKTVLDILVVLLFFVISLVFFFARWKGANPVLDLGGDAANVSTIAAVLDHPENFVHDFLYQSKEHFSYYVSFHIPYIRLFSKILGGYGLAYLSLLLPIIFIQLTGFYYFGKLFLRNRFWALLLSILSLIVIYAESSDYWGIYKDPQPRMLFGAFLPWLLAVAYLGLNRPKFRYLTMVLAGLMLYIHPVSTPGVAFSIWLGFLLMKPKERKMNRHLLDLVKLGAIFVIMAIPFTITYIHGRDITPQSVDFSTALAIFRSNGMAMFNIESTVFSFLKILSFSFLLPLAVLGVVIGWLRTNRKEDIKLILFWLAGLLFVGIGVTAIEQIIDEQLHILPVLLQLTRDFRYIIPLLEIVILIPLAGFNNSIQANSLFNITRRLFLSGIGVAIVLLLAFGYRNVTMGKLEMKGFAQQAFSCWVEGHFFCENNSSRDDLKVINFIAEKTEIDSSFISIPPVNLDKIIRYQSLRSIAFDLSDKNSFLVTDMSKYIELKGRFEKWDEIMGIANEETRIPSFLNFAKEVGADYAVVELDNLKDFSNIVVFSAGPYSIIDLNH